MPRIDDDVGTSWKRLRSSPGLALDDDDADDDDERERAIIVGDKQLFSFSR